jgi:diguanylate cyclase (GGDEF)-like protein/PAS domain S-box-containing protein
MPLPAAPRRWRCEMNPMEKNSDSADPVHIENDFPGTFEHASVGFAPSSVTEDTTGRQELEQQYRETFEQAGVGIVHTSLEGRYLRVNRRFCEMLGYSAPELVGRTAGDFTHPDDRDKNARNRQLLWDGTLDKLVDEKRCIRNDGRVIWTNRTVSLARDAAGKPMYFIRVIEDITERKEVEERYRATFDNAPVGIMHTSVEGYRILRANRRLSEMLGYTQEELLRMTSTDIVHPDYRFSDKPKYIGQLLAGESLPFASQRKFVRKDGSSLWVNRTVSLVKDASGTPIYFIRMIEDISERKRADETIANERALLRAVVDAVPERIYVKDREGRFLLQNAANVRAHGAASHEELLGKTVYDIFPRDVAQRVEAEDRGLIESGKQLMDRERVSTDAAGGRSWVVASKIPLRDAANNVVGLVGVNRDITAYKLAEQALKESEEQFRQLAHNIPQVFWMTDIDQKQLIYFSPAWETVSGQALAQVKSNPRSWLDAVHPEDRERVRAGRARAADGSYDELFRVVRPDGTVRWLHDRAFPVRDESGKAYRIAGIAEDVTERKLAEQQLTHLAHYDVLTNLPNRALFYDRLKQALAQAKRNEWIVAVMFIDLDRFKGVNDTMGHAVGDQLLRQVSSRLSRSVRAGDTVGRLGGDEFAIVMSGLTCANDANLVAQKIMTTFNAPFTLEDTDTYVTASIGITLYPDDGTGHDMLIKNADAAMYRAKDAGRNSYRFYTPEMNARALEILSVQNSLRRALDRDEFLLYYQPKASLADGSIVGVEALLRWRHPRRGLVSPAEFIPVLEETGLIVQVGQWVIGTACAQINAWRRAGIEPVPVAVNLSARQFQSVDLSDSIIAALENWGVEPRLIELEITESSLMRNADGAVVTLERLRSYGLKVSIDDFGTGYSSLAYLKRFPLHALKIDRSFVSDISSVSDDAPIIRAVISMAHSLGLRVVAEGVETETQLSFLAAHGCDEIQGYYFSRPVAAEDCAILLKERRRLRRSSSAGTAVARVGAL